MDYYSNSHNILQLLLLFFFSSILFSISSVPANKAADPLEYLCFPNSNYTSNTTYANNLKTLLTSFATTTSLTDFATSTAGTNETAYGLVQCRGDIVNATTCRSCVSDAASRITKSCPGQKSATIWYDNCWLHYADADFLGTEDANYMFTMPNPYNVTDLTSFNRLLAPLMRNLTADATANSSMKNFAVRSVAYNGFQGIYGMVQCTRDLSADFCTNCLNTLISTIPSSMGGKLGGRVFTRSCMFRYEAYLFYTVPPIPSAPPFGVNGTDSPRPPDVPIAENNSRRSTIIIVSVVVPVASLIFILLVFLFRCKKRKMDMKRQETHDLDDIEIVNYDLNTIKAATNNFSDENKLGEGGFGSVYKGRLRDGQEIAAKRMSSRSGQGVTEFRNEVQLIAKLQHRNLVRHLGCCIESGEKILVYEFLPNKSLDNFLFDPLRRAELDWATRFKMIIGIARGIMYLHEDSRLKIIHRDLKPSNVLLDENMNPKIADFGMAKLVGVDETQSDTSRIAGTYGYMSPEYAMQGKFSVKSDVFSFGVLMLEIISGERNTKYIESSGSMDMLVHSWRLWRDGRALDLIDETLWDSCPRSDVLKCIHIALLCVQENADDRPNMSSVLIMLGSASLTLPNPLPPAFFSATKRKAVPEDSTFIASSAGKSERSKIGSEAWSTNDDTLS